MQSLLNKNPVAIGGPGIHVEIYKCKFGRRKYDQGSLAGGELGVWGH